MGYKINDNSRLFSRVTYDQKTSAEIRTAMTAKVATLRSNIEARQQRMLRLRNEYDIDAERLAVLVMQFREADDRVSYEAQSRSEGQPLIPAGVISNLVREREMIDSEEDQIAKLELVLRNLCETEQFTVEATGEVKTRPCVHELSDFELEFLGF